MQERRAHRNIKHVPKVWGVTYTMLFLTLGGGLLITAAGFTLASGAGAVGKIGIICMGALVTAGIHGICWWRESRDKIDVEAKYLKNISNSQTASLQTIQLRAKARVNEQKRNTQKGHKQKGNEQKKKQKGNKRKG